MTLLATRGAATVGGRRALRHLRAATAVVAGLALVLCVQAMRTPDVVPAHASRLVAFDVGQGDALLVESADGAVMIDTGGSPLSDFDPGTALLAPALRARGIGSLDAVVISHLHADHAGGLAGLLAEIDVAVVWTAPFDPTTPAADRLRRAARDVPVRALARPGVIGRGGCLWRVLHPHAAAQAAGAPDGLSNDGSLVLSARCGGRSVLLTGDTERAAEALYAAALAVPPGSVLKSPHHGSDTSSGAALLDAAGARHVVIQAGWRNRFGLPDGHVVERYRDRRMAVYRTDRDGAVTLTVGRRVRVRGERWSAGRGVRRLGGWLH
jgi:competence protein ComEC